MTVLSVAKYLPGFGFASKDQPRKGSGVRPLGSGSPRGFAV